MAIVDAAGPRRSGSSRGRRDRGSSTTLTRLVVVVVVAAVAFATGLAWSVSRYFAPLVDTVPPYVVTAGDFRFLVSGDLPPLQLVFFAAISIGIIALASIALEVTAVLLTINPQFTHLERLRGTREAVFGDDALRIIVLVPAHNEAAALPRTLTGLQEQIRPPDRIVVIADNCSDDSAGIAEHMGCEAFETRDNVHKKGGALNQALALMLPTAARNDVILVMDADTVLGPDFIRTVEQQMKKDPDLAAVGGLFYGEGGSGLVGQFQRNEYARYALQLRRRRGRVFVLTGTATAFRSWALLDVAAARGAFIPGEPGQVYDTAALTEDNELTIALKSVGARMTSPAECFVVTEVMPTWRNLWTQRQRWQRGALENIGGYGLTRATLRYWAQQFGIGYGTVALNAALVLMLVTFLAVDTWIWFPFWAGIGLIFWCERVLTVWSAGWKARGLAALLLPELMYDVFLQLVFINSLASIALGRQARWGHVAHEAVTT